MTQMPMFGQPPDEPIDKPVSDQVTRLQLIVTVKAAPNPSDKYGETVCVAGISTNPERPGWIRLYPINFRELGENASFHKYDVVSVDAAPARQDSRRESWRPRMNTLRIDTTLNARRRREWIDPYVGGTTMCQLNDNPTMRSPSLGLIRPRQVDGFTIIPHPGWTTVQQQKIDKYVSQLDLFGTEDHAALQAPRFIGRYRYFCEKQHCRGHDQGLLDWEFVALQRRLRSLSDVSARRELENKFLHQMCSSQRDVAFYVGNQAQHPGTFSVLGVYWPARKGTTRGQSRDSSASTTSRWQRR